MEPPPAFSEVRFSVCNERIRSVVEKLFREYSRIDQLLNRIEEVKKSLKGSLRVLETFLRVEEIRVKRHQKAILSMKEALDYIWKEYKTTEDRINNYGSNVSISG
jgi:translation initiation factor 2B subunit (eIF-2B alpha/beta/delta family)